LHPRNTSDAGGRAQQLRHASPREGLRTSVTFAADEVEQEQPF
jgi:hypothetical protein